MSAGGGARPRRCASSWHLSRLDSLFCFLGAGISENINRREVSFSFHFSMRLLLTGVDISIVYVNFFWILMKDVSACYCQTRGGKCTPN